MIPHSQPDDPRTARGHGSKGDVPGEDEREDSQPRGTATPPSLYWVCQVFGWSCYCVVHVAYLLLSGLSLVGTIFYSLLVCFESFGITHCFRKIVRSHRWEDLPLRSLVFRVAGSTIVLAGLFALCTYLNSPIFASLFGYPADWSYFNRYPALLLIFFLNGLFVFGLWTSIYFGVHFVGQRRRAEQDRQRIALELSEARLAMLTEQINPHFLFNALNSVRSLIAEDPDRAQQAVTRLAALFRYSLQSDLRPTVPLSEELQIVDAYLDLERLRFDSRLTITRDIAPATLARRIPPMMLQTLVENAIKHGVSKREGPGYIALRTSLADSTQFMEIVLENNGTLEASDGGAAGVGIRNARERLHRIFGPNARLTLLDKPAGVIRATLWIPEFISAPNREIRE
jgi:two-component system LytT family sensor kinase